MTIFRRTANKRELDRRTYELLSMIASLARTVETQEVRIRALEIETARHPLSEYAKLN
jgi:hypothetical protein